MQSIFTFLCHFAP